MFVVVIVVFIVVCVVVVVVCVVVEKSENPTELWKNCGRDFSATRYSISMILASIDS